jgi:fused signal recognition particle receptor
MAFFSKLKERLFKSSSKIDEGLDAIIDEAPDAERTRPRQIPPRPDAPGRAASLAGRRRRTAGPRRGETSRRPPAGETARAARARPPEPTPRRPGAGTRGRPARREPEAPPEARA